MSFIKLSMIIYCKIKNDAVFIRLNIYDFCFWYSCIAIIALFIQKYSANYSD